MKKICKNCVSFKHDVINGKVNEKQGSCNNDKFVYTGCGDEIQIDGLGYWDYESYSAGFDVGAEFGCIHFKHNKEC